MKLKFLFLIILILFSFSLISAKSVCGQVITDEPITPSWYEVNIYFVQDNQYNSTCTVSPDGFKYCCSVEDMVPSWEKGMNFMAEIVDVESGYIASPVFLELTNKAYDIFPDLQLKKVLNIYDPQRRFNISKSNLTFFKVGFLEEYPISSFDGQIVHLNNGFYSEYREIPYGTNVFEIGASNGANSFVEKIEYTLLEEVNISRDLECNKCVENKIKKNEKVDMTLGVELSSNVSGFNIYEYVPYDWEILDSGTGVVSYAGGDYNVISWEVNGSSFDFTYSVKVPNQNEKYYFLKTYFEDIEVNEEEYFLYKFVPPFIPPRRGGGGGGSGSSGRGQIWKPGNFSKVGVDLPLIAENKSLLLALYSKNFSNEGAIGINLFNYSKKFKDRSLKFMEAYNVNTNLGNNFDRLSFELDLNSTYLQEKGYKKVKVYGRDSRGRLVPLTGRVVGGDKDLRYLLDSEEFFKEIVVFGVKSKLSWWDRIVQGFWNIFGFRTGVI